MRNPMIKNYFKNKSVLDATNDVCNMMCTILLATKKLYPRVMYPKTMVQFINDRVEYCSMSADQDRNDIFQYIMENECARINLTTDICGKIVDKFMYPFNDEVQSIYIDNIRLIFVQLHNEHGLGKERINKLISELLSDNVKPENTIEKVKEMGIQLEQATVSELNPKRYSRKTHKESFKEQKEAADKLNLYRRYSEEVLK